MIAPHAPGYGGAAMTVTSNLFLAASAGAAETSHEATPASPGEKTSSIKLGGYYPTRPGNGVTAGETAQLDNMGAAAGGRNLIGFLQSSVPEATDDRTACDTTTDRQASALSSVSPAQPRLHAPGTRDGACGHHTAAPQDHPPTQPAPRVAPGLSCLRREE